jgi:lipoate-protein ligase A
MFQVREYSLKDSALIGDFSSEYKYLVWIPDETAIVIGRGNGPGKSLFIDRIIKDGLPVYKRPSGGEAVIISPNTLVVSIADNREQQLKSREYFLKYNSAIIKALESLGVKGLKLAGISDIALNGKKILGCSLYRNKRQVFYHAVLNVCEQPDVLMKYLRYPKKTPDYRSGRDHKDFVTSLLMEGYNLSIEELKRTIALWIAPPI